MYLLRTSGQGVFFLLWPLFARAPRHWFLEFFLLSAPGVQSVFFLLRSVGCRDLSAGPEQKNKHHPGCFFLLRFFCSGPVPAPNGASPSFAFRRDRSKKKKKHPGWCFFFCSGPVPARGFSFPCLSPGPEQKKKHPGWCFFCCGPARTLTHSLRAWVAMPPPRRGGVFFFCCGPARTLTVGWGDFGKARVFFFFLLRPRRVFLDNNKKCLGYYIGSKKTRRGHSKKKTPLPEPHSRTFQTGWPGHSRCNAQRPYLRASKARRILHPTWRLTGSYK